jgi:hypothetical protein
LFPLAIAAVAIVILRVTKSSPRLGFMIKRFHYKQTYHSSVVFVIKSINLSRSIRRRGRKEFRIMKTAFFILCQPPWGRSLIHSGFQTKIRTASKIRKVPIPSTLATYSGESKKLLHETLHLNWISSGCTSCMIRIILVESVNPIMQFKINMCFMLSW